MKQTSFERAEWTYRFSHGGSLRNQRAGRTARPLSSKEPIHLVLKTNKGLSGAGLRSARRFALAQKLLRKYSAKFHVKVEQVSIQFDHIHLLVRITRRSLFQNFLRVFAGQIAQQFQAHGLSIQQVHASKESQKGIEKQNSCERTPKNAEAAFRQELIGTAFSQQKVGTAFSKQKVDRKLSEQPSEMSVTGTPHVKLWKYRPFTRVVRGWKAYRVVRDYIQLNEKEATGEIRYCKKRLRGLHPEGIAQLWEGS